MPYQDLFANSGGSYAGIFGAYNPAAAPSAHVFLQVSIICQSGDKGVSKHTKNGNWVARLTVPGGPYKHLGCFDTPEEAALAYNTAALALFGAYAYLNDVPAPASREERRPTPDA